MLLRIQHQTHYDYAPGVQSSAHELCLHLRDTAAQHIIEQNLQIEPAPQQRYDTIDAFGNLRTHIAVEHSHQQFIATASSTVRTLHDTGSLPPSVAWQQAAERAAANPKLGPFLAPSAQTVCDPILRDYARPCFAAHSHLLDACVALTQQIHRDCVYTSYVTTIFTPVLEFFQTRRGVCQDFSHLMLSVLRSMGLPCRYVSGYLLNSTAAAAGTLIGADASHAWISVFVPTSAAARKGYWYDFCPTNARWGWNSPGMDFVTLAFGRDYHDVPPIRGVLTGNSQQKMQVAVRVEALA